MLHQLVISAGIRDVKLIQHEQILPRTKFYDELLTNAIGQRQIYFEQIRRQLFDADLVFLDPDNGIETKSTPQGSKNSSKYIYWDELREIFTSGCSILVYQHFRREEWTAFIKRMVTEFQSRLGTAEVYLTLPARNRLNRGRWVAKKPRSLAFCASLTYNKI